MEFKHIIVQNDQGIVTITFNRPKTLNALNAELLDELLCALTDLNGNEGVRVVILTGAGEKAFVAGADINEINKLTPIQAKRFAKRKDDPLKQYKLSPVDQKSQKMWDKYTHAKYLMLQASHTDYAPWTIVRSDNKKKARINCIKHILSHMEYPEKIKDKKLEIDTEVVVSTYDEIQKIGIENNFIKEPKLIKESK